VTTKETETRDILRGLDQIREHLHIAANPSKCGILNLGIRDSPNTRYYIGAEEDANAVPIVNAYKYLGHTIDNRLIEEHTRREVLNEMEQELLDSVKERGNRVLRSKLSMPQKLRAFKWIAFGQIRFLAPSMPFSTKFLNDCTTQAKIVARRIGRLLPGALNEYMTLPIADGGLGIDDLKRAILFQRMKFWATTLSYASTASNVLIASNRLEAGLYGTPVKQGAQKLAENPNGTNIVEDWHPLETILYPERHANHPRFFGWKTIQDGNIFYIDRSGTTRDYPTRDRLYWFTSAQWAMDLQISVEFERTEIIATQLTRQERIEAVNAATRARRLEQMPSRPQYPPKTGLTIRFPDDNVPREYSAHANQENQRKSIKSFAARTRAFKSWQAQQTIQRFKEEWEQSRNKPPEERRLEYRFFASLSLDPDTRRRQLKPVADLLRFGRGRKMDKILAMVNKGRLQQLGNVRWNIINPDQSPFCPRTGCDNLETTGHLFGCLQTGVALTARHNAIQDLLVEAMTEQGWSDIIVDRAVVDDNRQRPDLTQAIKNGVCQVGEVTVSFETGTEIARQTKLRKYEVYMRDRVAQDYARNGLITRPDPALFIVGPLGTLDHDFMNNLAKYDITGRKATLLADKISKTVLNHSYGIWASRCMANFNR
jgi:hypothetical protein